MKAIVLKRGFQINSFIMNKKDKVYQDIIHAKDQIIQIMEREIKLQTEALAMAEEMIGLQEKLLKSQRDDLAKYKSFYIKHFIHET